MHQVHPDISFILFCVPRRVGFVVRVPASLAVGRGFLPRPDHTKDHHKNGTNCLPDWHPGIMVGVRQCYQTV